jgi:hypothetical protein
MARAAALEAQIIAEEARATGSGRSNAAADPDARPATTGGARATAGGLAVAYAHEYDYVRRDLRRIAILAVVLLALLFIIFIAIQASGIVSF